MTSFKCKIVNRNKAFACFSDRTLLESALISGVAISYRCSMGYCGLCKVKLKSGKVKMEHSGGISRKDTENGFILPCCTIPFGDIEIETNE
nr:2Fe-2S iron-sulfur cluster binding domain-containing protein [Pantoea sp. At-9b]